MAHMLCTRTWKQCPVMLWITWNILKSRIELHSGKLLWERVFYTFGLHESCNGRKLILSRRLTWKNITLKILLICAISRSSVFFRYLYILLWKWNDRVYNSQLKNSTVNIRERMVHYPSDFKPVLWYPYILWYQILIHKLIVNTICI